MQKFDKSVFLNQFKQETEEHLQKLNQNLLLLEKDIDNREILDEVFREAHTLKGSATMMGFTDIRDLAHALEDVLDKARHKSLTLNENIIDALFKSLDAIKILLDAKITGVQHNIDISSYIDKLKQNTLSLEESNFGLIEIEKIEKEKIEEKKPSGKLMEKMEETIRVEVSKLDQLLNLVGELIISKRRLEECLKELSKLKIKFDTLDTNLGKIEEETEETLSLQGEDFKTLSETLRAIAAQNNVLKNEFVDVMEEISEANRRMEIFTHQIQEGIMKTRMLPLSTIFALFPRVIRDLARDSGKKINLEIIGEDVELDKRIIDEIQEPLIHIIRNAVDHGIETPLERSRAGKKEVGRIKLTAKSRGSQVLIEIEDDGKGLDLDKIKKKAVETGIIEEKDMESLEESEIIDLLFVPGFSTQEMVTTTSGRGVGLDVVKEKVEKMKGTVEVKSKPGKGCRFIINLPLTLSLTEVLLVKSGGQTFAIPISAIEEMVKYKFSEIDTVGGKEAIYVREEIIPLVRLSTILGQKERLNKKSDDFPVVIVSSADRRIGFMVEELVGKQEIVIKTLGSYLSRVNNIAGATILGDGQIVPILDISALIHQAKSIMRPEVKIPSMVETDLQLDYKKEEKIPYILAVEDSLTSRELLKSILEAVGYRVEVAMDGVDAWEKLRTNNFDLMVTDIEMPRMDGFELITKVRSSDDFRHLPVVIVTTREKEEDKRRGIEVGADAYIVKGSFDQRELLECIKRLVGR